METMRDGDRWRRAIASNKQRFGTKIGQIETEIILPIRRIERGGRCARCDPDERGRQLRSVRQDDRDSVVVAYSEEIQCRDGTFDLVAQSRVGKLRSIGRRQCRIVGTPHIEKGPDRVGGGTYAVACRPGCFHDTMCYAIRTSDLTKGATRLSRRRLKLTIC